MGRPNRGLRSEIRTAFRGGRIYRGRWMQVRVGKSDPGRMLIAVRKKFGGSVVRNRARRRLREICRGFGAHSPRGVLVMISLRDEARAVRYRELRSDLFSALRRLGLLDR